MKTGKNNGQMKLWGAIAAVLVIIIAIILFILFNNQEKYTVTFDSNGGSTVVSENIKNGKTVVEPDEPTREGYKFLGWYLDDEKFNFSTPINEDIDLIAKWEKVEDEEKETTYNVKVEDGISVRTVKTDEEGYVAELSTPEREGYAFKGWYVDEEKFDFSKPITKDITLVARWEKIEETEEDEPVINEKPSENSKPNDNSKPNNNPSSGSTNETTPQVQKYTVKFTVDGKTTTTTVEKGTKVTLPTTPVKEGYTFKGWYASGVQVTESTTVNSNLNVEGVWDTYTFEVGLINNEKTSPNVLVTVYKNGTAVTANAIYGNLNGNAEYTLGKYSNTYSAIKVVSREQFESANNYKVEVNGSRVYALER